MHIHYIAKSIGTLLEINESSAQNKDMKEFGVEELD